MRAVIIISFFIYVKNMVYLYFNDEKSHEKFNNWAEICNFASKLKNKYDSLYSRET